MSKETYILFDLEAAPAQVSEEGMKHWFQEIVEIGAVKIEVTEHGIQHMDEYHQYISPTFGDHISRKWAKMTGVTDVMVKNGVDFITGFTEFIQWAGEDAIFVCWSICDIRMIESNIEAHKFWMYPTMEYLNLQELFDDTYELPDHTGLKKALYRLNIEFVGQRHHALNDAKNMIPIFENLQSQILSGSEYINML
ncbi:3'-5' exonuclease [Ileibacterium valens]|uniref:3'-5' exonuclease n=1 Tax=Ileibacterium valens TaxID=1862668 RepID=UPI002570AF4F|nr:3'-5' exonuclease [Ileibacterium valens]